MLHNKEKNLVEVCPQCCKIINSSANRLVQDSCGHLKCRICLLQEITGCLLCGQNTRMQISNFKDNNAINFKDVESIQNCKTQQRKSVITSVALQEAEKIKFETSKSNSISPSTIEKDTCNLIKQGLEQEILFPTDIVKRSTGNFYHLKRIFSQRFFNEHNDNKKHKAYENEEKRPISEDNVKSISNVFIENSDKINWKIPEHIQLQYFCKIHNLTIQEKSNLLKDHMTCAFKKPVDLLFKCKICDKGYKIIGKLNRHMKTHTKNSVFKCGKCGKSCIDNYALKIHERTHNQLKPYSCTICEKKFSGLQNIKRHEKLHKNEKNFICNDCGFRFITLTELKRHAVTHSNIKSFSCSKCNNKFTFKRTLTRHLRTHDNSTKIKCAHCESTFKRKDNLERHIKTTHFEMKVE